MRTLVEFSHVNYFFLRFYYIRTISVFFFCLIKKKKTNKSKRVKNEIAVFYITNKVDFILFIVA